MKQSFNVEIVTVHNDLTNQGIRVIVASLDMNFIGNQFRPMLALMTASEYMTKVHAVCT